MGELGFNKIFGSILAAALGVMGLQTISSMVFSSGGHHGHHGEEKPYCESIKDDNAYWTAVPCDGASVADEGPAYDLGALLASADAAKGERVFKSVCSSCHTINQGGADGTGPNLYGLVNRDIASIGGFGYSGALAGVDGDWSYEQLDAWIMDPANIARGVNMVANVKRDPDRANLIAYLAANTPDAPAFPAPLPEEGEAPAEGDVEPASIEEAADGAVDGVVEEMTEAENEAVLDEMEEIVERMEDGVEELGEMMDASETTIDGVEASADAGLAEVVEAIEETVDGVEMPEAPELVVEEPSEDVPNPR